MKKQRPVLLPFSNISVYDFGTQRRLLNAVSSFLIRQLVDYGHAVKDTIKMPKWWQDKIQVAQITSSLSLYQLCPHQLWRRCH